LWIVKLLRDLFVRASFPILVVSDDRTFLAS